MITLKEISLSEVVDQEEFKSLKFLSSKQYVSLQQSMNTKVLTLGIYQDQKQISSFYIFLYRIKKFFYFGVIHNLSTTTVCKLDEIMGSLHKILKKHRVITLYTITDFLEYKINEKDNTHYDTETFDRMNPILLRNGFVKSKRINNTFMNYEWQYEKDLSEIKEPLQLLKSFSSNYQRRISKAEKSGYFIEELGYDNIEKFLLLHEESADRQEFRHLDLEGALKWYSLFKPTNQIYFMICRLDVNQSINYYEKQKQIILDKLNSGLKMKESTLNDLHKELQGLNEQLDELYSIRKQHSIIDLSAGMFFVDQKQMTYYLGGNASQYLHLNGSKFLQYEMMKMAMKLNIPIYNFFVTFGPYSDQNKKMQGVYNFKKHFKGYPSKYPHYYYNVSPLLAKIFKLNIPE